VLGDDLRVVILLEEGQEIVLVDVGLVAEAHDRGTRPSWQREKPMIANADATRLRRKGRLALDIVRRAERRASSWACSPTPASTTT